MIVNSYNIEFGYELLSAVPHAYGLFLRGKLKETISGSDSEPLYYFSPKHTINKEKRSWFNTDNARRTGLPFTFIHRFERPKLVFPPYKEVYKNTEYKWQKPTLCICNRYNREWGQEPINYFSEDMLNWLFSNLKDQYEIVYFAVGIPESIQDNESPMHLNDLDIANKHNVKVFQDIKGTSWNESMLKVFSNCEHFITMNGGYSIMASLFGGTNIIYTRNTPTHTKELDFNSFYRWYPNHNNQRTTVALNFEQLKDKVKAIYINKLPTANIIVRTSKRQNAFSMCMKSIEIQDYPNINVIVTTDEREGVEYTRKYPARHLHFDRSTFKQMDRIDKEEYGLPFIQNEYLDIAQRLCEGYIMFLDDDDMFTCSNAISTVISNAKDDSLIVWRTDMNDGRIIPNGNFGKQIKLYDITGIGICYHSKHVDKTDWSQWKRADYRTAKKLSESLNVVWIDAILTKLQHKPGMGNQTDIYVTNPIHMKTVRMKDTGKVKRLDDNLAKAVVENGSAEYISDVIDSINRTEVVNKVVVTKVENKELQPVTETQEVIVEQEVKKAKRPRRGRN